jgi:hypothetical protein
MNEIEKFCMEKSQEVNPLYNCGYCCDKCDIECDLNNMVKKVLTIYQQRHSDYRFGKPVIIGIERYAYQLEPEEIEYAMEKALKKDLSPFATINYFFGICRNMVKQNRPIIKIKK